MEEEQTSEFRYHPTKALRFSLANRRKLAEALPYTAFLGVLLVGLWVIIPGLQVIPLWTVFGGVGGLFAGLYKQQLDDTEMFNDLFRHFNGRFEALNQKLDRIVSASPNLRLEPDDRDTLMDYFNLCAEEFLYHKSGYLDEEVWRSWLEGMKFFAKNSRIGDLWREELASQNAYYGFPPSLVGL